MDNPKSVLLPGRSSPYLIFCPAMMRLQHSIGRYGHLLISQKFIVSICVSYWSYLYSIVSFPVWPYFRKLVLQWVSLVVSLYFENCLLMLLVIIGFKHSNISILALKYCPLVEKEGGVDILENLTISDVASLRIKELAEMIIKQCRYANVDICSLKENTTNVRRL